MSFPESVVLISNSALSRYSLCVKAVFNQRQQHCGRALYVRRRAFNLQRKVSVGAQRHHLEMLPAQFKLVFQCNQRFFADVVQQPQLTTEASIMAMPVLGSDSIHSEGSSAYSSENAAGFVSSATHGEVAPPAAPPLRARAVLHSAIEFGLQTGL